MTPPPKSGGYITLINRTVNAAALKFWQLAIAFTTNLVAPMPLLRLSNDSCKYCLQLQNRMEFGRVSGGAGIRRQLLDAFGVSQTPDLFEDVPCVNMVC